MHRFYWYSNNLIITDYYSRYIPVSDRIWYYIYPMVSDSFNVTEHFLNNNDYHKSD